MKFALRIQILEFQDIAQSKLDADSIKKPDTVDL